MATLLTTIGLVGVSAGEASASPSASAGAPTGYTLFGAQAFGEAESCGFATSSFGAIYAAQPVVGMAVTANWAGGWLVTADGGVFSEGDARFYGSTGAIHLNKPIVSMTATPEAADTGSWPPTEASSPSAMPASTARRALCRWSHR
jgi:hypothetical protein